MMRSAEEQREKGTQAVGRGYRVRLSGSRGDACRRSRRALAQGASAARSRAGFTLIELTVAIGILLIGMLVSFASQITSGQIIDSSEDVTIIVADLERCMERILLQSADDIPTVYPENVVVPGFTAMNVREEDIVPRYINWTSGDPIPDILEIELTATWVDGVGRPQRQTLTTAKSR